MSEKIPVRTIDELDRIEEHTIGEVEVTAEISAKAERRGLDYDLRRANKELASEEESLDSISREANENYKKQEDFLQFAEMIRDYEDNSEDSRGLLHFIEAGALAVVQEDKESSIASSIEIENIVDKFNIEDEAEREEVMNSIESQIIAHSEYYESVEDLSDLNLSSETAVTGKNQYFNDLTNRWFEIKGDTAGEKVVVVGEESIIKGRIKQLSSAVKEMGDSRVEMLAREKGEIPVTVETDIHKMNYEDMSLVNLAQVMAEAYKQDDRTRMESIEDVAKARFAEKYADDPEGQEKAYEMFMTRVETRVDKPDKVEAGAGEVGAEATSEAKPEKALDASEIEALAGGFLDRLKQFDYLSLDYQKEQAKIFAEITNLEDTSDEDKKLISQRLAEMVQADQEAEAKPEMLSAEEIETLAESYLERLGELGPLSSLERQAEYKLITDEILNLEGISDEDRAKLADQVSAFQQEEAGESDEAENDATGEPDSSEVEETPEVKKGRKGAIRRVFDRFRSFGGRRDKKITSTQGVYSEDEKRSRHAVNAMGNWMSKVKRG